VLSASSLASWTPGLQWSGARRRDQRDAATFDVAEFEAAFGSDPRPGATHERVGEMGRRASLAPQQRHDERASRPASRCRLSRAARRAPAAHWAASRLAGTRVDFHQAGVSRDVATLCRPATAVTARLTSAATEVVPLYDDWKLDSKMEIRVDAGRLK
jgi:hypothetical protein